MKTHRTRALATALALAFAFVATALAGTISTKQVSVAASATSVSTGSLNRQAVTLKAHDANTDDIYCGPDTVTTGNGFELGPGDGITFQLSDGRAIDQGDEIECISASGTQTVSVAEHLL